jgi:hypothetical protein
MEHDVLFIMMALFIAEKVIYFLLLDRKKRKPCHEDDTEVIVRNRCGSQDPPRKRIDSHNKNGFSYTELSQGSPITPRRKLYKYVTNLSKVVHTYRLV